MGVHAMIVLELPAPPSVNTMFRNTARGRVKTQHYVDWQSSAGWKLRLQKPASIKGDVIVVLGVEREARMRAADIDNRVKAMLDLLVTHGVIEDDKHAAAIAAAWNPPASGMARVAIMPVTDGLTLTYHHAGSSGAYGGWFVNAPENEGATHYGD
jgi:crossover junction endodeoxyribonuclease RusA